MLEVQVSSKIKLVDARAQLRLSIRKLAELAEVDPNTVLNAEHGAAVLRTTAYAILKALNEARTQEGKPPLELSDIDWSIRG